MLGTPVLVNGRCDVTRKQCQQSRGGLYYGSYDEFAVILDLLLGDPDLAAQLGRQGRRFVESAYTWDAVTACYLSSFAAIRDIDR
jgi:glycosyltransferase involved in cell wall biosynthesis